MMALLLALAAGAAAAARAETLQPGEEPGAERRPQAVDIPRACPSLRIAVVNGVPFHYEVLAGLLHVLRPYERHMDVFISPHTRGANGDGAWNLISWSKARFLRADRAPEASGRSSSIYDLAVLVSPDYELEANLAILPRLRPHLTLAIVHNSDFTGLAQLLNVTQELRLLTLAPHVARSLAANTGRTVDWVLPTFPFKPRTDCLHARDTELLGKCLRGFAVQGKFSNQRRNYSSIWAQVQARRAQLAEPDLARHFHINVLGKGRNRLNLPPDLQPLVTLHRRLHFKAFYEVIHHNYALIPALAGQFYYQGKFSSTIITSLSTGTPMVVSAQFLAAYTMFTEASAYLQRGNEGEVDAMIRVMRLPAADLLAVRAALRGVQARLNERAAAQYDDVLRHLCRVKRRRRRMLGDGLL